MYRHREAATVRPFLFNHIQAAANDPATFSKPRVGKYHGEIPRGEKREKRISDETVDRLLALARRRRSGGRKYEGDDAKGGKAGGGEQKGGSGVNRWPNGASRQSFFLTFHSNAGFLSFPSSLSPWCPFLPSIMPDFFTWFRSRCVPPPCLESSAWILDCPSTRAISRIIRYSKITTDYFAKEEILLVKDMGNVHEVMHELFYRF